MASYFITGASRGIGLGLVAALASQPASEVSKIFAAVRTQTDDIKKLVEEHKGRVELVSVDTTSEDSVKAAASQVEKSLGDKGLDVLLNLVGQSSYHPGGITTMNDLGSLFNTNVLSTHYVTRTFLPLLDKGSLKKIINVSSTVGSITLARHFQPTPTHSYKITKAAFNMLTVQYALELENKGYTVIALSPGWVKTNLGGDIAHLDVDTSVQAVLKIIFRVDKESNGKFIDIELPGYEMPGLKLYDGGNPPW